MMSSETLKEIKDKIIQNKDSWIKVKINDDYHERQILESKFFIPKKIFICKELSTWIPCLFCKGTTEIIRLNQGKFKDIEEWYCEKCSILTHITIIKKIPDLENARINEISEKKFADKTLILEINSGNRKQIYTKFNDQFDCEKIIPLFQRGMKCKQCKATLQLFSINRENYYDNFYDFYCKICKIETSERITRLSEINAEMKCLDNLKLIKDNKIMKERNVYDEVFGNENYLYYANYQENFLPPEQSEISKCTCKLCKNPLIYYNSTNPDAWFAYNCEFNYYYCKECKMQYREEIIKYYL